nr:hypothetical protein CFP56_18341 [Quercus suber]
MNRDSSTDPGDREMEGHISVETSLKWLEGLSKGMIGEELETITMEGLKVVQAQKGFIRCHFLVPNSVAEEVEIEAKVMAEKEILTSVVVEVRQKDNGKLIALGKQWMTTRSTSKIKLSEKSKL